MRRPTSFPRGELDHRAESGHLVRDRLGAGVASQVLRSAPLCERCHATSTGRGVGGVGRRCRRGSRDAADTTASGRDMDFGFVTRALCDEWLIDTGSPSAPGCSVAGQADSARKARRPTTCSHSPGADPRCHPARSVRQRQTRVFCHGLLGVSLSADGERRPGHVSPPTLRLSTGASSAIWVMVRQGHCRCAHSGGLLMTIQSGGPPILSGEGSLAYLC